MIAFGVVNDKAETRERGKPGARARGAPESGSPALEIAAPALLNTQPF